MGGERETGAEQGVFKLGDAAHAYAAVVQLRAAAARGGEEFIARRVEHHRLVQAVFMFERDGNAEVGQAVQKVGGAVERVDDPYIVIAGLCAGFFPEKSMVWVGGAQD